MIDDATETEICYVVAGFFEIDVELYEFEIHEITFELNSGQTLGGYAVYVIQDGRDYDKLILCKDLIPRYVGYTFENYYETN